MKDSAKFHSDSLQSKCSCGLWNFWDKYLPGYRAHGVPHHTLPCNTPIAADCLICVPQELCEKCYRWIKVGDWPFCPHASTRDGQIGMLGEFHPYYDHGLSGGMSAPVFIDSLATRNRIMREGTRSDGRPRGYRLEHRGAGMGMPGVEF